METLASLVADLPGCGKPVLPPMGKPYSEKVVKEKKAASPRWTMGFRRPQFSSFSEIWTAASVQCLLAVRRHASLALFIAVLLSLLCCCDFSCKVHPLISCGQ